MVGEIAVFFKEVVVSKVIQFINSPLIFIVIGLVFLFLLFQLIINCELDR